jgi:hypothetical protein
MTFPQHVIDQLRSLVFSLPSSSSSSSSPSSPSPTAPLLISIEGNVGAGKSTLLQLLRDRHPEWVFIDEPVDFWESLRNPKGQSLFEVGGGWGHSIAWRAE